MSRSLTPAFLTAISAGTVRPVVFVEGETADQTVRFWSGIGDLSWNSHTWTGAGALLSISTVAETNETQANGVTITLNGIPSDLVSLALQELRRGKPARAWLGAFDTAGAIISDPYLFLNGRIDSAEINDSGDTAAITVSAESRLIDFDRAPNWSYTLEDHQREYAGDMFFQYVPLIQDISLAWGNQSAARSTPK